MIVAVEIDRDIDLSLFSRFLHQSGIWHRINESGDVQVVWVQNEEDKERVVSLYRQFTSGEFELKAVKLNVPKTTNQLIDQFMRSPLTVSLILINVLCFPVTSGVDEGNFNGWFQMMTLLEGRERSISEWSELFRQSGLKLGDTFETGVGFTLIEGKPN